mgnify:CR=1 FL=1|tara:strand:- start:20999 stop:21436 length:438 start_codon:yes stop_codon:yes gene_type:complete
MQATMTENDTVYYRVKERRYVHLPLTNGRMETWAEPGDVICIDHPLIREKLKGQEFKLEELKGLPKGAKVAVTPQRFSREIDVWNAKQRDGGEAGEFPPVGRPSKELEDTINELKKQNEVLKKQNASLKRESEDIKKRLSNLEED